MRKTDEYGMPESSEFIEELDSIFCKLDQKSQDNIQLSRKEMAIWDVYAAIGIIEGDGLMSFWEDNDVYDRILESFRIIGANKLASIINESNWVKGVIDRGINRGGQYRITKAEEERLSESEEHVYELFIGLPTRLLEFAKENRITG